MTETRVWCDRCSTLITADRTLFALTTGPERLLRPKLDLCARCLDLFLAWIDAKDAKVAEKKNNE